MKAPLCQLLIVACLSSVVSDVTPSSPPQESPHRNEEAGGDRIVTPPHPRATTALAASPTPRRGSSFSSPLHYSCDAEPRRSATWPMINTTGCGAKSSPSGGAIVPVLGRTCRRRPGPGGLPCGGVARGAAPGSGVGDGGGGAGFARGSGGKNVFFQMAPTPPLSVSICSTRCQYDTLKIWLKKNDHFLTCGAAKVHIFCVLVTELVTDLFPPGTDPVLVLPRQ